MRSPSWPRPSPACPITGNNHQLASLGPGLHLPAMAAPRIDIDESPDAALRDDILRPLRAFNESRIGLIKVELLAITLRDPESGEIIAGLCGSSGADSLSVDLLVIHETFHGYGLGTDLLRQPQEIARKVGC